MAICLDCQNAEKKQKVVDIKCTKIIASSAERETGETIHCIHSFHRWNAVLAAE